MPTKRKSADEVKWKLSIAKIKFEIPISTRSENNLREHWTKKAKRVKAQRNLAKITTIVHIVPIGLGIISVKKIRVTLTRVSPRELDSDNLAGAFKAVRDGIADAFMVNDRDQRIEWAYTQRKGQEKTTEVLIEEVFG